ncbi:amidase family [Trichoderma arundinaceum]|uniref:Amidase family n=1 Tax=Trichoderma arundinaceum TaxID=490622 RepID=A0A395NEN9_TRIAR|nr:amidase family [Trichoderma arundinaceum]
MSHNFNVLTATADELQHLLSSGSIDSKHLVKVYLSQIKRHNDYLKAVVSTAPEALLLERAGMLDDERKNGKLRSPLHGIPILIKDNIATHTPSTGLDTTAGSLALAGSNPRSNAPIVDRIAFKLLEAGLILIDDSFTGHSNPGGSSSGSAIAVAAGFAPISIGTETFGSLMLPAGRAALYSIKPGRSHISLTGIVPISSFSDQPGPMTKTTKDLAMLMDIITDPENIPSGGYASRVTGSWEGLRIGTVDPEKWKYPPQARKILYEGMERQLVVQVRDAYEVIKQHATVFKDNVPLGPYDVLILNGEEALLKVFERDFKEEFENYLKFLDTPKVKSLGELIAFNKQHADKELPPGYDNQDMLELCEKMKVTSEDRARYVAHLEKFGRDQGVNKIFEEYGVNIIMGPIESPLYYFAAASGYPVAAMPLGYLDYNGRPHGLCAVAREEGLLIQLQSAYEGTFPPRKPPILVS